MGIVETTEKNYKMVLLVSWFTILYNLLEGAISIFFGISEGSVALAGFGGDSFIEVGSAFVVLWRFRIEVKDRNSKAVTDFLRRERLATISIGTLFLLLMVMILTGAVLHVLSGQRPDTTLPGVIVSTLSILIMIFLWKVKKRLGHELNSSTMTSDADCTLACIKLSVVLLVGSGLYWLIPELWWVDAAGSFILAFLIGKEGIGMIRAAKSENFTGGCKSCAN